MDAIERERHRRTKKAAQIKQWRERKKAEASGNTPKRASRAGAAWSYGEVAAWLRTSELLPPLRRGETVAELLARRSPEEAAEDARDFARWQKRIAPVVARVLKRGGPGHEHR